MLKPFIPPPQRVESASEPTVTAFISLLSSLESHFCSRKPTDCHAPAPSTIAQRIDAWACCNHQAMLAVNFANTETISQQH